MSLTPQDHVIDDFAGAGGWHHALRALGADPHSYELNPDACNTLRATGSTRVHQGDLTTRTTGHQPPARLYVASPPCQGFSMAGLGAGRQPHVMGAITHAATMIRDGRGYAAAAAHVHTVCPDPRVALVLWPLYWALTTRPENIALEQVPAVLPIWQLYARLLEDAGYSTATGYLTAEQYDVPQTRKRAILVASLHGPVALPPPRRRKYRKGVAQHEGDPALLPWVAARDVCPGINWRWAETPFTTVAGDPRITAREHHFHGEQNSTSYKLTVEQATAAQGFPADYPWQGRTKGSRYLQVGNAVPPPLAWHVVRAALRLDPAPWETAQ